LIVQAIQVSIQAAMDGFKGEFSFFVNHSMILISQQYVYRSNQSYLV